jgi:carbon-monoxide dehydrogenase large subunit
MTEVAETDNPLGVKGIGEGPTTGAPAAVMGAVRDALSVLGTASIDMPVTPENVWRAIRATRAQSHS